VLGGDLEIVAHRGMRRRPQPGHLGEVGDPKCVNGFEDSLVLGDDVSSPAGVDVVGDGGKDRRSGALDVPQ
jgi:hypothetical protein